MRTSGDFVAPFRPDPNTAVCVVSGALRFDIAEFLGCDERVLRAPKPGAAAAQAQKEAEIAIATAAGGVSSPSASTIAAAAGGRPPPVPARPKGYNKQRAKGNAAAPPPQPPVPEAAPAPAPTPASPPAAPEPKVRSPVPAVKRTASSAVVAQMNADLVDAEVNGAPPPLPQRKRRAESAAGADSAEEELLATPRDPITIAQAASGLVLALFAVIHIGCIVVGAVAGGLMFDLSLSIARWTYQTSLGETILFGALAIHIGTGLFRFKQRLSLPPPESMLLSVYYHRRAAVLLLLLIPLHVLLMRVEPAAGARGRSADPHANYAFVQYVLREWWFPVAFVGFAVTLAAGYVHCALYTFFATAPLTSLILSSLFV